MCVASAHIVACDVNHMPCASNVKHMTSVRIVHACMQQMCSHVGPCGHALLHDEAHHNGMLRCEAVIA